LQDQRNDLDVGLAEELGAVGKHRHAVGLDVKVRVHLEEGLDPAEAIAGAEHPGIGHLQIGQAQGEDVDGKVVAVVAAVAVTDGDGAVVVGAQAQGAVRRGRWREAGTEVVDPEGGGGRAVLGGEAGGGHSQRGEADGKGVERAGNVHGVPSSYWPFEPEGKPLPAVSQIQHFCMAALRVVEGSCPNSR